MEWVRKGQWEQKSDGGKEEKSRDVRPFNGTTDHSHMCSRGKKRVDSTQRSDVKRHLMLSMTYIGEPLSSEVLESWAAKVEARVYNLDIAFAQRKVDDILVLVNLNAVGEEGVQWAQNAHIVLVGVWGEELKNKMDAVDAAGIVQRNGKKPKK